MTDEDLLMKLKTGNNDAFKYLINTNRNLVWSIALGITGSKDVSEDLFQEVFFRVYRDINKFRGDSKLSTWIGSIGFNVCSDFLRKKTRNKIFSKTDFTEFEMNVPGDKNPGDELHSVEINEMVRRIIDNLPSSYKLLINLYHLEELSYKEIAIITNLPPGTIKSYLSRARLLIKAEILKHFPDFKEIHYESFV
ncbi:MAG: sigma-70 family RNA polymerase sigma factor [Bacteroidales bacterium]|nr:sigma-70 family RNA polymerase sigma factor [Bacteroidales bacterium]MCF8389312.1 sigma-70 family RNA polymerase sigma factor [Bacteroidales bacterium]